MLMWNGLGILLMIYIDSSVFGTLMLSIGLAACNICYLIVVLGYCNSYDINCINPYLF